VIVIQIKNTIGNYRNHVFYDEKNIKQPTFYITAYLLGGGVLASSRRDGRGCRNPSSFVGVSDMVFREVASSEGSFHSVPRNQKGGTNAKPIREEAVPRAS
jgi:hypothetical protein